MSKKHFELAARVIRSLPVQGRTRVIIAKAFADAFALENERFDRIRFLAAATRERDKVWGSD